MIGYSLQISQASSSPVEALMVRLSRYLGENFGKGFSVANLKNFRQFYLAFPTHDEFATHCVANLGWSHIRIIMRLENRDERNWYLKEAAQQNWSVRILDRNVKSGYYRRLLSVQNQKAGMAPDFRLEVSNCAACGGGACSDD